MSTVSFVVASVIRAFGVLLLFASLAGGEATQSEAQLPIPSNEAQAAASKKMRVVFAAEFKQSDPAERLELARKLLDQGSNPSEDAASRFVFWREARDRAAKAGNYRVAQRAIEALSGRYEMERRPMELAALSVALPSTPTPQLAAAAGYEALSVIDETLAAGEYDAAERLQGIADTATVLAKDATLTSELHDRASLIRKLKSTSARAGKELEALKQNPEDPALNLSVGRYLCLTRGDWARGLPLLAKGADPMLQACARTDLSTGDHAPERKKAADQWWDAAANLAGSARSRAQWRAIYWYQRSIDRLSGLDRIVAEQRIANPPAGQQRVINLLAMVDPVLDARAGTWKLANDGLSCRGRTKGRNAIAFRYAPPAEYDYRMIFTRTGGSESVSQIGAFGQAGFFWMLGASANHVFCFARNTEGATTILQKVEAAKCLINARQHTSLLRVRKDRIQAYLDGKLISELRPNGIALSPISPFMLDTRALLGLDTAGGAALFSTVEVVEVSGRGNIHYE